MSLDHYERSVAVLGAALNRVATPAWSLLLADRHAEKPPVHFAHVLLHGIAGSTPVDVLVVGGAPLVWVVAMAEETAFPAAFCDGDSSVIIDLGLIQPVAPDPAAVLAGLREALETTLVLVPAGRDLGSTSTRGTHPLEQRRVSRRATP